MIYAWKHFSHAVKHETRYMFFDCSEGEVSYCSPDEIPPGKTLMRIGKSVQEAGLLATVPKGSRFFRAREHKENIICTTACDLGPPPRDSTSSNRMSPAGIVMFYGAGDAETAIGEAVGSIADGIITVGAFDTLQDLIVLDLCNMPSFPSLFDCSRRHFRGVHRFLRDFVADLSRPIDRDGREHSDYVPTQIVTEYFRHQFRTVDGKHIQGILYPSSKREDGRCCVLFCSQENCTEKPHDSWRKADQWLRFDPTSVTRLKDKTG